MFTKKMRVLLLLFLTTRIMVLTSCDNDVAQKQAEPANTDDENHKRQTQAANYERIVALKNYVDEINNQVAVCEVPGGPVTEKFQDYLKSKGLRNHSPGGDEMHTITVHKDDRELFLAIADKPEIIERFSLFLHRQPTQEQKPEISTPRKLSD